MLYLDFGLLRLRAFSLASTRKVASHLSLSSRIHECPIGAPLMVVFILAIPIIDVINELAVDGSVACFELTQKGFGGRVVDFQFVSSLSEN